MTTIKAKISEDMLNARRSRDKGTVALLTMALDKIQKKEKDELREISDQETLAILQTFVKQLDEERTGFEKRGDTEAAQKLLNDTQYLASYFPPQLDREAVDAEISKIIDTMTEEAGQRPMISKGDLMKRAMAELKGKADNRLISAAVNDYFKG